MLVAFKDFETRNARVQLMTANGYLAGRIRGGNREVCMFAVESRAGALVEQTRVTNVVLAQIISYDELSEPRA